MAGHSGRTGNSAAGHTQRLGQMARFFRGKKVATERYVDNFKLLMAERAEKKKNLPLRSMFKEY